MANPTCDWDERYYQLAIVFDFRQGASIRTLEAKYGRYDVEAIIRRELIWCPGHGLTAPDSGLDTAGVNVDRTECETRH